MMNTARTIPRIDLIKSHEAIRSELLATRAAKLYDPVVIQYRKAKNIFKFFKEGLLNLYRARRDLNREIFNGKRYIYDYSKGDSQGRIVVRWSDYDRLVECMSQRISLVEMERKAGKPLGNKVDYGIDITKDQFIEMVHLKREWFKVPLFGVLFLALEEFSLPIVYLFPALLPKTCVLPGRIEKRFYAKRDQAFAQLDAITAGQAQKTIDAVLDGTANVWAVPEDQLQLICSYLHIFGVGSRDRRIKLLRHIRELGVLRHMDSVCK